ncbi:MAG: hypothetical protein IK099_04465 [Clostridia bacterium]|nr:hypothetical protein [Clostridia bacterium]
MEQNANTSALKTEEAVLLPALPRHSLSGRLALQAALQKADAMKEKQIGSAVSAALTADGKASSRSRIEKNSPASPVQPAGNRPAARAALYHILRSKA